MIGLHIVKDKKHKKFIETFYQFYKSKIKICTIDLFSSSFIDLNFEFGSYLSKIIKINYKKRIYVEYSNELHLSNERESFIKGSICVLKKIITTTSNLNCTGLVILNDLNKLNVLRDSINVVISKVPLTIDLLFYAKLEDLVNCRKLNDKVSIDIKVALDFKENNNFKLLLTYIKEYKDILKIIYLDKEVSNFTEFFKLVNYLDKLGIDVIFDSKDKIANKKMNDHINEYYGI